jgi:hypothetical protein
MGPAPAACFSAASRRAHPVQRRLRLLAWLTLAGSFGGLGAADSRTTLPVTVTVLPVARLELAAAPAPVLISAADLARGFVDAPRPLRLRVYSNSRAGFTLDFATLSPWFTAAALAGLDGEATLGPEGGSVAQRWQGQQTRALELRVRFRLADGLQPGLYAWPLQLSARPL